MSYQPINHQQQYYQQNTATAPPQVTAVPIVYGQPYHHQPQPVAGYQPIGSTQPSVEWGLLRDAERRKQGTRRCTLCCALCLLVFLLVTLGIFLAIYYGAIKCRGGSVVTGTCPVDSTEGLYLAQPREFTHGSQCHEGNDQPGDCCNWRSSTCLTAAGCRNKYEYGNWAAGNSTCKQLLGLLSCAPASNNAGLFMGDKRQLYMCSSFCNQLWQACKAPDSNPTDYCNGLAYVTVRNLDCYSGAGHIHSNMISIAMCALFAFILARIA